MISITAFGRVPPGRMVRRDRAQPGDVIFVSGTIGDAALGLDLLTGAADTTDAAARAHLLGRYRVPQPRTGLAVAVRDHAHAAMDVSDGLAGDLAKLCAASEVSAVVETADVPMSGAARAMLAGGVALDRLLTGGDDYEILCTIPQQRIESFLREAGQAGIAVAAIGHVTEGRGVPTFRDQQGRALSLSNLAYSHF